MNTLTHFPKSTTTTAIIPGRISPARNFDLPSIKAADPVYATTQFGQFAVNNPMPSMQSCPFASPRACPTGGACHLCPARS
jgi:hypothetical protein